MAFCQANAPHLFNYTRKRRNNSVKIINKKLEYSSFACLLTMTFWFFFPVPFRAASLTRDNTYTCKILQFHGVIARCLFLMISLIWAWISSQYGTFARCSINQCSQHSIYFGLSFFVLSQILCFCWYFCSRPKIF